MGALKSNDENIFNSDMFHKEEREVPSAAIIYTLYMNEERISLEGPKEKFYNLLSHLGRFSSLS